MTPLPNSISLPSMTSSMETAACSRAVYSARRHCAHSCHQQQQLQTISASAMAASASKNGLRGGGAFKEPPQAVEQQHRRRQYNSCLSQFLFCLLADQVRKLCPYIMAARQGRWST